MIPQGVILYGPPASGKDAATAELSALDPRFELFRRLKAGAGRTAGYRITTRQHLRDLSDSGGILYSNARYGAVYGVDQEGLDAIVDAGKIPVLHLGQVAGVDALLKYPISWTTILLWCSREATRERCEGRGSADISTRLEVWDETLADLHEADGSAWSMIIDTENHSPSEAADLIARAVTNPSTSVLLSAATLSQ